MPLHRNQEMNAQNLETKKALTSVKFQPNISHGSKIGRKIICIICVVGLVLFLAPVYFSTLSVHIVSLIGLQLDHRNVSSFPEFRLDNSSGVQHLSHVCIEPHEKPMVRYDIGRGQYYNETQMIVVYRTANQTNVPKVVGIRGSPWAQWQIRFVTKVFRNLERKICRILRSLLIRLLREICSTSSGISTSLYSLWLTTTLHAVRTLDAFYNLPENTCFQHAVFAANRGSFGFDVIVDHILRYYNMKRNRVNESNEYFLTITKRQRRRMLNIEDVATVAKDVGFKRIRIVDFETLSLVEQLKMMMTTKVFVGIQGAGLQWAVFMPRGGFVVEIAWPQKHHPFYYHHMIRKSGLRWKGVIVQDVRVNWASYSSTVRNGVPVPESEKANILATTPLSLGDNLWKWADVMIKKHEILDALTIAYKETK